MPPCLRPRVRHAALAFVALAFVALAFVATARAQRPAAGGATAAADPYFALVRPLLNGERAKETVAYLDRFVRWPGNPGFDSSITHVAARLAAAGYVEQSAAKPTDRLTYRVERYPLPTAAWEPQGASVRIVGKTGALVFEFATNRNMLATNSFSTPAGGVEADLVWLDAATPAALDAAKVAGKIVAADGRVGPLFTEAVVKRGAIGVLAYAMPAYTQPEKNVHSIQFQSIAYDSKKKAWGMALSFDARRQLRAAAEIGRAHV